MKCVAIIPARGGSKSIPRKNVRLLAGRPLIYWGLDAACNCPLIDKVFVATEDAEIAKVSMDYGNAKVNVFSRSAESATDTASTEVVMLEFARQNPCEHIALIQATSPLLQAQDLTSGLNAYLAQGADSLLSVVAQKRFIWQRNSDGFYQAQNYAPVRRPRRQEFDGFLVENGAFYVTKWEALLATGCRISGRILCHEMSEESHVELDDPTDWEIISKLLQARAVKMPSAIKTPIRMVLTDVDGVLTDGGMYYGSTGDSFKKFNTRDGMGMELLRQRGLKVGILTKEQTEIVAKRAAKLRVDVLVQGCDDKAAVLQRVLAEHSLHPSQVAFIGDDLNDLGIMQCVGLAGAPADAAEVVKSRAHYVCKAKGGQGCFREFAEEILRSDLL